MTGVSSSDRLLTPTELAERWQVVCKSKPAEAIYRMVRTGVIPRDAYVLLGKQMRLLLSRIERFEQEGGRSLHGHEEAA